MTRAEAYWILGKMWENATDEQKEAISMAQNDLEVMDLMPKDIVAVVRCRECENWREHRTGLYQDGFGYCVVCMMDTEKEHFCSYGERKEGAE